MSENNKQVRKYDTFECVMVGFMLFGVITYLTDSPFLGGVVGGWVGYGMTEKMVDKSS